MFRVHSVHACGSYVFSFQRLLPAAKYRHKTRPLTVQWDEEEEQQQQEEEQEQEQEQQEQQERQEEEGFKSHIKLVQPNYLESLNQFRFERQLKAHLVDWSWSV